MSGEQLTHDQTRNLNDLNKSKIKRKVDINVLLNKVRSEEKKEKFENVIFISLISFVILVTGIIVSF